MTPVHVSEPGRIVHFVAKVVHFVRSHYRQILQRLRYLYYLPFFDNVGDEVIFGPDIRINKPENISVGTGTFVGRDVTLNAVDKISLGEDCGIAAGSYFMTWNHVIDDRTVELRATGKESAPINVGDGVWVGYNAVILPGVSIGTGGVVGAGAVVNHDVPEWTVVAGVPAEPIAKRTADGVEPIEMEE